MDVRGFEVEVILREGLPTWGEDFITRHLTMKLRSRPCQLMLTLNLPTFEPNKRGKEE